MSLDELAAERRVRVKTPEERVRWLNTLREIVGRRCEKNSAGTPLVSDYDLLDATAEEIELCIAKIYL